MLIITRRTGEEWVICDDDTNEVIATLMILGVKGNQVRVGVNAKRKYNVDRKEIHERRMRDRGIEPNGNT